MQSYAVFCSFKAYITHKPPHTPCAKAFEGLRRGLAAPRRSTLPATERTGPAKRGTAKERRREAGEAEKAERERERRLRDAAWPHSLKPKNGKPKLRAYGFPFFSGINEPYTYIYKEQHLYIYKGTTLIFFTYVSRLRTYSGCRRFSHCGPSRGMRSVQSAHTDERACSSWWSYQT